MILLAVYLILIGLSAIMPKSRKLFYSMLVFLWFVAAFCTDHADYKTYLLRYNIYLSLSSMTETGFNLIMYLFHKMSFDFQGFLCVSYAFTIGTVGWFIKKYSPNCALCMALYSIFPFCIDAVQLRNTIAFCVCLIGMNYLMNYNDRSKGRKTVVYIIAVIVASFIHFSSIAFLIILISYYFDVMKTCVITGIATIFLMFFGNADLLNKIATLFVSTEKVDSVLGRIMRYDVHNIHAIQFAMLVTTIIIFPIFYITYRNNKLEIKYGSSSRFAIHTRETMNFSVKTQIVSLVILPIVYFALDVYRVHRYILILGYIGISLYGVTNSRHRFVNQKAYNMFLVLSAWVIFYLQIYRLNNFESTFLALFTNNKFF